jgi:dTDP-4-amino-4,6-dideoxygalactose transaminase
MRQNTDFIPYSKPCIGPEEERAVLEVLRSGWLTTGRAAAEFERMFALFTGAAHALAVSSATAGLHLSLDALRVPRGSLVITTPYTFTATAETIRYMSAHPLFVDIEERSFNIDPSLVEAELRKRGKEVSCIVPVHVGGLPCDMPRLAELSRAHGVPLVEDCAHAFPLRTAGKHAGRFGATGVFSFYANKPITTGEGGMIVTDDDGLARRMRIMRLHGIDRESWERYTSQEASWQYDVVDAGYKYNMTDIAAAIGIEQLKKAETLRDKRRAVASMYFEGLEDLDFLALPQRSEENAWHLFVVRIVESRLSIGRDELVKALREKGIGTSVHYIPLHIMSYYRKLYGFRPEQFPVALANYRTAVSLPMYPDLGPERVERVIRAIRRTCGASRKKAMATGSGRR